MQVYLDTYGAFLGVRDGMFHIRLKDGQQHALAARQVSSIQLQRGTAVSTDALLLALSEQIPVIFTDDIARPLGQLWNSRYGSISTIRKRQALFCQQPEGARWMLRWMGRKMQVQQQTLREQLPEFPDPAQRRYVERAEHILEQLQQRLRRQEDMPGLGPELFPTLRGWEGTGSRAYFKALAKLLPPHFTLQQRVPQPAPDPVNATLNYLYSILYSKVELALLQAGLDPHLGIFHADQYNRPTMVYDFIEPFRCWADTSLLDMARKGTLYAELYSRDERGRIVLARRARQLCAEHFLTYLYAYVPHQGKQYRRLQILALEAQSLAQLLGKPEE